MIANDFSEIMVMGAGAVGGFFGGKLSMFSNRRVSFVARGSHLRAIQKNGLTIKNDKDDFTVEEGEKDGVVSGRIKIIKTIFEEAGVPCRISMDIRRDMWKKFSWNSMFNMLTAAENETTDYFYENGSPRKILWKLADELLNIAGAEDVKLEKRRP